MISILLAVYNGEQYLRQSIDSVLNQSFKDFELLIGFNGTIDGSKNIAKTYCDKRIKIFDYGIDKGKAKTLNKLIIEARYDWCAIQDDDDVWLPNKLEKQIVYTNEYDVIGSQILYIDTHNRYIGQPALSCEDKKIKKISLNGINQIANSSAVFKKSLIQQLSGWKEMDGVEDYDLWLRMIAINALFINIPEPLVLHRLHDSSNFNSTHSNNLNIYQYKHRN